MPKKKPKPTIDGADIVTIARAMVNQSVEVSTDGPLDVKWCVFCDSTLIGTKINKHPFKHARDCPTRIAEKILAAGNERWPDGVNPIPVPTPLYIKRAMGLS